MQYQYQVLLPRNLGVRLDRWLADQMEGWSRSQIQRFIDQGQVQINQQVCRSKKQLLQAGDQVKVEVPPPTRLELEPEPMALDILYEDEYLLVVNKPAGLVVHPAPGHYQGTLVHGLLAHCQSEAGSSLSGIGGVERPGIVHRLDRDTSGAMVIAKTNQAHHHLQAQLAAKTARRQYLAIVHGHPPAAEGSIDQPIGRHPVDRIKMAVVAVGEGGRPAVTHWQVQQRLGNYTLMQFQLETGRTHQIRVHAAYLGWPIVGDPVYCRGKSMGVNLSGQVLHAWKLSLLHPITETWLEVAAPLPLDFQTLLERLQSHQSSSL